MIDKRLQLTALAGLIDSIVATTTGPHLAIPMAKVAWADIAAALRVAANVAGAPGTDSLTRPIVGVENRTAQEVFDIMCGRIELAARPAPPASAWHGPYRVKWIGAGVWAGIADELPGALEGMDVYVVPVSAAPVTFGVDLAAPGSDRTVEALVEDGKVIATREVPAAPADLHDAVARAIEAVEFQYSMNMIRLVDGVATYRFRFSDGSPDLDVEEPNDGYLVVAEKRMAARASAAIAAMQAAGLSLVCPNFLDDDVVKLVLAGRAVAYSRPAEFCAADDEARARIKDLDVALESFNNIAWDDDPSGLAEGEILQPAAAPPSADVMRLVVEARKAAFDENGDLNWQANLAEALEPFEDLVPWDDIDEATLVRHLIDVGEGEETQEGGAA